MWGVDDQQTSHKQPALLGIMNDFLQRRKITIKCTVYGTEPQFNEILVITNNPETQT